MIVVDIRMYYLKINHMRKKKGGYIVGLYPAIMGLKKHNKG
jgi:hypothetical protein